MIRLCVARPVHKIFNFRNSLISLSDVISPREKSRQTEMIRLIKSCQYSAPEQPPTSPKSPKSPKAQDWSDLQQSRILQSTEWSFFIQASQKDGEVANALVSMLMGRIQGGRESLGEPQTPTKVALRSYTYKLIELVVSVSDPNSVLFKVVSTAGMHLSLLKMVEMLPHNSQTEEEVSKIENLLVLLFTHHELLQLDLVDHIKTILMPLSPTNTSRLRGRKETEDWMEKTKIQFILGRLLTSVRRPRTSHRANAKFESAIRSPKRHHLQSTSNEGLQIAFDDLFLNHILLLFSSDHFDLFEEPFTQCYSSFALLEAANPNTLELALYKLFNEYSQWIWLSANQAFSAADRSRLHFLLRAYNAGGMARAHWKDLFKTIFALLERVPVAKIGENILDTLTHPGLVAIFTGPKALQRNADWPGFAKCLFTMARCMGRWATRMINRRGASGEERAVEEIFPGEKIVVKLLGVWKPSLETLSEVGAVAVEQDPHGACRVASRVTKVTKLWQKVETKLEELSIFLPQDMKPVSYSDLPGSRRPSPSKELVHAQSETALLTELASQTKPAWLMHLEVGPMYVRTKSPIHVQPVVGTKSSSSPGPVNGSRKAVEFSDLMDDDTKFHSDSQKSVVTRMKERSSSSGFFPRSPAISPKPSSQAASRPSSVKPISPSGLGRSGFISPRSPAISPNPSSQAASRTSSVKPISPSGLGRFIAAGVAEDSENQDKTGAKKHSRSHSRSKASLKHGPEKRILTLDLDKVLENLEKQSSDTLVEKEEKPSHKKKKSAERKAGGEKSKKGKAHQVKMQSLRGNAGTPSSGDPVKKCPSEPKNISPINVATIPDIKKQKAAKKSSSRLHQMADDAGDKAATVSVDKAEDGDKAGAGSGNSSRSESKKPTPRTPRSLLALLHLDSKTELRSPKKGTEPSKPSPQGLDSPHTKA